MFNRSFVLVLGATALLGATAMVPSSASGFGFRGFGGGGGFHSFGGGGGFHRVGGGLAIRSFAPRSIPPRSFVPRSFAGHTVTAHNFTNHSFATRGFAVGHAPASHTLHNFDNRLPSANTSRAVITQPANRVASNFTGSASAFHNGPLAGLHRGTNSILTQYNLANFNTNHLGSGSGGWGGGVMTRDGPASGAQTSGEGGKSGYGTVPGSAPDGSVAAPPSKYPVVVGTGGGNLPPYPTRHLNIPPILTGPPLSGASAVVPTGTAPSSSGAFRGPLTGAPAAGPLAFSPSNTGSSNTGPANTGPAISGPGPLSRFADLPPVTETRYVPNEVLLELPGNPTEQIFNVIAARHRLDRLDTQRIALTNSTWVRWRIADGRSVPAVIRTLEADNMARNTVLWAQPNYLFALQQEQPADTDQRGETRPAAQEGDSAQYALAKLHLPQAQMLARGNGVLVGVIDTEIDTTHAELVGAIADRYDALGIAGPRETHGTAIAGTIAAHTKLLGAAPNVRILAIRAFSSGISTTDHIIKGLDYAVARGARVINMSFAGPADPGLSRALGAAHNKGCILIAAVGNKGPASPALFPAADPNVIAVTATDAEDHLFQGANRGDHVAIAAPGVDILVAAPGNRYAMQTGTSFASAYVAGAAALLAERKPDITPDAAKRALMSTAHQLGQKPRDPQFGAGLMDAYQAVLAVAGRPAAGLVGR
jgi:hypothetical protein